MIMKNFRSKYGTFEPTKDSRIYPCQGQLEDDFKSSKVGSYMDKLEDILYFLQEYATLLNFLI